QVALKDPKRALQIARKNLKTGVSSNLMSTVATLRQKDPDLAAELANDIAEKALDEKVLKSSDVANAVAGLLFASRRPERRAVASNYAQPKDTGLLTDKHYRELL